MDLLSKLLAEKEELARKLDENAANIAELSGVDVGGSMIECAHDAVQHIPPDSWLVNALIPSVGFGVIGAPPYAGKSFLATHMAGSIASGRHIFGPFRANSPVPVLYIYYESGRSEFLTTLKRSLESRGIDGKNIFVNAGNIPNKRLRIGSSGFEAAIRASGARFIVADTLSFASDGKDESNEEFQHKVVDPTVDLTKRLGVYILYVHHSQKNTEGVDEVYSFRGGSTLSAGADTLVRVDKLKNEPRESKRRKFTIVKARGAHCGHVDLEFDFHRRVAYAVDEDPREVLFPPEKLAAMKSKDPWKGDR